MTFFDLLQRHNITLRELSEKIHCEYFKLRYFAMLEIHPLEELITKNLANFFSLSLKDIEKIKPYWLVLPLNESNKIEPNGFIVEAEMRLITAYEKWEYQAGNLKYWIKHMEEIIIQEYDDGELSTLQVEYLRKLYLYDMEYLLDSEFLLPISYKMS